jgi:D-alanyl-D-alanine dipeptidase
MILMSGFSANIPGSWGASQMDRDDFVYLRDVDNSILQDIKYAGIDNFTGSPVPGYGAPECMLLRPVAEALKRIQADLKEQNLSLKVFDCYRPHRSVRAFVEWTNDGNENELTKCFYPRLNKQELFGAGYISMTSGHSRGNAIDLTLVKLTGRPRAQVDATEKVRPCTTPAEHDAELVPVDMGTSFDCFDALSYTASSEISPEAQRWRKLLVGAMEKHGFKNYRREWWHFTYRMPDRSALKPHDFPIVRHPGTSVK